MSEEEVVEEVEEPVEESETSDEEIWEQDDDCT
mgnify:CR=1 FL=1